MKHSQTEKTLRSYEVSVNAMLKRCKQHQGKEMVKAVLKTGADGEIEFDFPKLAESLENNSNVYFRYTLQYQIKMNTAKESGLGHIKRFRGPPTRPSPACSPRWTRSASASSSSSGT